MRGEQKEYCERRRRRREKTGEHEEVGKGDRGKEKKNAIVGKESKKK